MKKRFFLTIFILLAVVGVSRISVGTKRTGFFYPAGCLDCHENRIIQPGFSTQEHCRARAHKLQKKRQNLADEFECRKNCEKITATQRSCDQSQN